ncbi:MAG: hypothetical protein ACK5QT_07060 [Oligoflexia bacterium]
MNALKLPSGWVRSSVLAGIVISHWSVWSTGAGAVSAAAAVEPQRVFQAEARKTRHYLADGVVVGGDSAIQSVRVKEIRRAANSEGFERIVIDLQASRADGEPTALARAPYYQVSINPEERRLIYTITGKPRLDFDAPKVVAAFKKSPVVQSVELLPAVHADQWSFVLNLKSGRPVEVFDLSQPARIITDIRLK